MGHDLIVTGGTVIDGTGAAAFVGDVAVDAGLITEVGVVSGDADRTIDASDLLVTPGFVDVHTHYDGQASWGERMIPSSWHGVTTVVAGNCGVGFAPVHPADHGRLIELMEGVEDIPGAVLDEGLTWSWQSFPEFMDALDGRPFDVAVQVPHGALRQATASAVGLLDRGVIAPGYRADLNLIDFERLSARRPEMRYDLPASGRRLVQTADGYAATIVAGAVTYEHGDATGPVPGRLERGPQTASSAGGRR